MPVIEARFTKDREAHHLLQRPRDVPWRTGLGAMAITFYVVLALSVGQPLPPAAISRTTKWLLQASVVGLALLTQPAISAFIGWFAYRESLSPLDWLYVALLAVNIPLCVVTIHAFGMAGAAATMRARL